KTHRVRGDTLEDLHVPTINEKFTRSALTAEELASLIATTRGEVTRARMTGPDRSILYATAAGTGFRLGELMSLTPESFNLDGDPPTITCLGAYTKNGKKAEQPIRPELAEVLFTWLAGKPPGRHVFAPDRFRMARAVRNDLEAAGVAD